MPEIFQIKFFGSQTSCEGVPFFPGQNVHARVVLHLLEPMNANSINLHISGKAEVNWTRSNGDNKTDHFRSEAIYLNQNIQLWAPPDRQIPPNIEHIFPFQFTVPPNCPPSFGEIGSKGRIHYYCSAQVIVVTTSFCCGSRAVELPLLIGTIPIHDQQEYPNLLNPTFTQPNASSPFPVNFIPSHPSPYSCYSEHPLPLPTNKEIHLEQIKHR